MGKSRAINLMPIKWIVLPPDLTDAEKQAKIDGYTQSNINLFNSFSAKVDAGAGGKMWIIRYQDELKFYANALKYSWSPAKTPEGKKAALLRIFKTIDNHVKIITAIRHLCSGADTRVIGAATTARSAKRCISWRT